MHTAGDDWHGRPEDYYHRGMSAFLESGMGAIMPKTLITDARCAIPALKIPAHAFPSQRRTALKDPAISLRANPHRGSPSRLDW